VSPKFFLAEAWRSIRANAAVSVAATVTVLIAVFILGAFIPSFLYVQSTVDSQKAKVDIDAFISDSATVQQVQGLRNQLDALQAQGLIRSHQYVSKDDALAELRGRLKDPSILEELPSNPLPAKENIKPTDPDRAQAIIDQISDSPAIDPELGISYGKETAD
jgi:cell division transport system permease protein